MAAMVKENEDLRRLEGHLETSFGFCFANDGNVLWTV
jgi:hypothetical protein